MKGNDAIAHAAIRYGADGYFGYPITPQSEILETLMDEAPWQTTGMVVMQAESELAAINMVYGGAGCGKAVFTSSSSPGMSLMLEGVSYMAGAELPCLLINVMRGGPGLGTIQASQSDYFQAVKGGGHGDYNMIVLAPSSVQEMADFVAKGFDYAFAYRNPVMILADGVVGQMMEKVKLPPFTPRKTEDEIRELCPWASLGRRKGEDPSIITSIDLDSQRMEQRNLHLQKKYKEIKDTICLYEEIQCDDADYILVAYGSSARICRKAVEIARAQGIKVGLIRPITLWPFPSKVIQKHLSHVKGFMSIEMSAGQMVEDVQLAVKGQVPVEFYGRLGGIIPTPDEVVEALKNKFN